MTLDLSHTALLAVYALCIALVWLGFALLVRGVAAARAQRTAWRMWAQVCTRLSSYDTGRTNLPPPPGTEPHRSKR